MSATGWSSSSCSSSSVFTPGSAIRNIVRNSRLAIGMILTAGLGTRLRPLTSVRAKPAIPVGGEPLVRRIARWLAAHGVTDIVLNLHYLPETIAAAVGDGSDLGVRARYSWEQPV